MNRKIKIGVIPAAGQGRRINSLPLTRVLPKCLLPVLNKPILEYVIANMKRMGVQDVYVIVGFKKELIQEYFGNGMDFGVNISYVLQPNPLGIAHAVELTRAFIDEPFVVILGDDLTIAKSLSNMIEDFWTNDAKVVEGVVYEKDAERLKMTCCVELNDRGKVLNIAEKPRVPMTNVRGCGIYIFDPVVYDYIKKTSIQSPRNEKEITNTIKLMAEAGLAYGSFINGVNINVNTMTDLQEAMLQLMNIGSEQPMGVTKSSCEYI